MRLQKTFFFLGLFGFIAAAQNAQAAGFYIQEQSAKQQGDAFAGAAANPEDASILFNNPAGMTDLPSAEGVLGLAVLVPHASLKNEGSNVLGGPVAGNDGGNPFDPTPVPSAYIASPVNNNLWVGLSVTAPFGLSNEYNKTWFGRYNSTESVLTTEDIQPAIAYKLGNGLSLGGGIDIEHAHAELDQAVLSIGPDLQAEVNGDSWHVGYNLGAMWDVDQNTRLGLHYRSAITQNISGDLTGLGPSVHADAELKLPNVVELGVTHQFSPQLKLLGSFNWFGWDRFNEIHVHSPIGDIIDATDYRNTFAVALGAEWKQDDRWTWRGGLQFDETPTVDGHRDTRVPDSNRYWISLGGTYNVTPTFALDGAISHLFMPDASVNFTNQVGGGPPVQTIATSSNSVDIISLQGVVKF